MTPNPSSRERLLLCLLGLISLALVGGALFFQYFRQEDPCPLCILQRYAYLAIALFAWCGAASPGAGTRRIWKALVALAALAGLATAARHIWVLSHPGFSCGFDALQPFVDSLPPANWLPGVFRVAGLCETPHPPILGLSLPAWSLIGFLATLLGLAWNARRQR